MIRVLCLCVTLLVAPLAAQAERVEQIGPTRLVCLESDGLVSHVERLTILQIDNLRRTAQTGGVKWPCDDVWLRIDTVVVYNLYDHYGPNGPYDPYESLDVWIQTKDKWWVLMQTIWYPGTNRNSLWYTVDIEVASRHEPIQYVWRRPNYFPVVPDNNDNRRYRYYRDDRGNLRQYDGQYEYDNRRGQYNRDERYNPHSERDSSAGESGLTIDKLRRQLGMPPK